MKIFPLYLLQRHPLTIKAHFAHSLVLTYAFPAPALAAMLPPGLSLDAFDGHGFVAIAMVETESLRPAAMPRWLGQRFFLAGYRIFVRFRRPDGVNLRGLYILRSDTDRRVMAAAGNLLTHYHYRVSQVQSSSTGDDLHCEIHTAHGEGDLSVVADLRGAAILPEGSPFRTHHDARRYAGPLPYTFDHEPETHSVIAIKGVRRNWNPRLVPVHVGRLTFFNHGGFASLAPRLASAFYVEEIDYQWNRGVRYGLAS